MSYCGLCGTSTIQRRCAAEQIDWDSYDSNGRFRITGESVELNLLPENVQILIKEKKSSIKYDAPICPRCYSKTLDEIWRDERSLCKECNETLVDIGYAGDFANTGHTIMVTNLLGCPKCRRVYFLQSRPIPKKPRGKV